MNENRLGEASAVVSDLGNSSDPSYYPFESGGGGGGGPFDGSTLEGGDPTKARIMYPETQWQNVVVLAFVFIFALAANFMALPVILFRRTKFGNGLFAVLILCLTISDLSVTFFSVLGSLIVEASHLLWGGAPGSCQVYHWLSAWMSGLSAYLLVAIVGMVMVKTTTSSLQRLRDCRWLLLALLVTSGIYALPELFIRSTVNLGFGGAEQDVCILGVYGITYALYVAFRLAIRYVIPCFLVYATIVRPETKLSKRVSHLFFGHLSAPCSCGEGGSALGLPHECPTMQTAMLKAAASEATTVSLETGGRSGRNEDGKTNGSTNGGGSLANNGRTTLAGHSHSSAAAARPDLVADSEPVGFMRNGKVHKLLIQPEDPHRRKYKLFLSFYFLFVTILNLVLDIAFQIQSTNTDWVPDENGEYTNHSENLATAIYAFAHLQQIGDPLIFLTAEFIFS